MADRDTCGGLEFVLHNGSFKQETDSEEKDGALNSHCHSGTSLREYDEPNGQGLPITRKGDVSLERAFESGKVPKRKARKSFKIVTTENLEPRRPSGFNIEIFEGSKQLILRLLCFCCNLILKDPVQTEDGIRLCSDCADYIIKFVPCILRSTVSC
jgi:hypothetical protein